MKISITGTHLTPAVAVIEELKNHEEVEITYYIGRSSTMEGDKTASIESKLLADLGIKFLPLISGRLQHSFTKFTIFSLLKIPIGFVQSFYYLLSEKPDIVLSFGGYVSVPVVICAWFLNIPIIIHEQTLVAGWANIISGVFADKIALSFFDNKINNNKKYILTGNPIRKEILNPKAPEDRGITQLISQAKKEKKPLIFITGGNQGSHIINQVISEILDKLTEITFIIHQTGDSKYKDFDRLLSLKQSLRQPERYLIRKWIDAKDLGFLLKRIDLAVSRAGINTLSELALSGVPTLSVPLPYLSKNEQMINALYFKKIGLVQILPQKQLTSDSLFNDLKLMLVNLDHLKKRASSAKDIIVPDAAPKIVLEIFLLLKNFNEN